MNYESYDKKGNVTTHTDIKLNGPISNSAGFILSIVTAIVGFIITFFFTAVLISDYNIIKNFVQTTAIVTEKEMSASYTVQYYIDNTEYTNHLFDVKEHNVGDEITIYYKANDYDYITYEPDKIEFVSFLPIIFGLIFLISGIVSAKKHANNVMHYIEPEKYELIDSDNTTSIGTGDNVPANLEFNEKDTSFKRIKF